MKVCLACSAGGHLAEILQLEPFYGKREHYFVTFRRADTEGLAKREKVHFAERPARNPIAFVVNAIQSLAVILGERPDLVISTGADVALATCWWAKLLGKKVIYVESFCRPYVPGVTGKLVEPIADLLIVQWKPVQKHYKKAVYGGPIF